MSPVKSIFSVILFALIFGASTFASNQTPINESNWLNHPQIKEIREICTEIEADIQGKKLKESRNDFGYDNPNLPISKVIYIDNSSIARKFIEEWGSDDSALTCSYYYDSAKRLRFVFIQGGAVNGSKMEHRIYFDSSGKRIWEIQKYLKGPGYTFPEVWPQDQLVLDPGTEFKKKLQDY